MCNIQADHQEEQWEEPSLEGETTHQIKPEDLNITLEDLNQIILKPSQETKDLQEETEDMQVDQVTKCTEHHQEE